MRILITGSRAWTNKPSIARAILDALPPQPHPVYEPRADGKMDVRWDRITLIVGRAAGADTLAEELAIAWGMDVDVHPADWKRYGKAAGPIRNQEMVDSTADACLAFPVGKSKGTRDCIRRAEKAGIPVKIYEG